MAIDGVGVQGCSSSCSVGDLAGPGGAGAGTPAGEAASVLPLPASCALSGDSMTALAMLLTQADNQDRADAEQTQDAADVAAMQAASQQVQAMRDQANQDLGSAIATGVGQMVGGALTMGAACAPGPVGGGWNAGLTGAGQAMPGVGTVVAGGFKAQSDQDAATAAQLSADSQEAIRQYGAAQGDVQDASSSLDKVQQFLQSIVETEAQAGSAAASMLKG